MSEKFLKMPNVGRIINTRFIIGASVAGNEEHATIDIKVVGEQVPVAYRHFHAPLKRDAQKQAEVGLLQLQHELQEDSPNG